MMKETCIILNALARQEERLPRADPYPKSEDPEAFAIHLASPRNPIKGSMIIMNLVSARVESDPFFRFSYIT